MNKNQNACMQGNCQHDFDCAVHNEPASPAGECDCSVKPATSLREEGDEKCR